MLRLAVALLLTAAVAAPASARAQQDSLAAARDLYTTADYREALAMLTRLRPATTEPASVLAIEQYRAFALAALGRDAEAELAVEAIAQIDPAWTLPAGEASPRITTLFARARERALPGVLRQRLAAARALYAEKSYDASAEAFTSLLLLLEDAELARLGGVDVPAMTALATGFRDLSLAAGEQARAATARQAAVEPAPQTAAVVPPATDPPTSPAAPPTASTPTGTATSESGSASPAPDAAGTPPATEPAGDAAAKPTASTDIVPPVPIAQSMPPANERTVPLGGSQTILLDIVIDEMGRVERAEVRRSVNRLYETQLVAATRGWRYRPATQGGRPVEYARTVEVTLKARD